MRAAGRSAMLARWGAAVTLALGMHAVGAAALLAHWQHESDAIVSAPVILIDLSPVAAAPAAPPTDVAPGPPQPQVEEQPEPAPEKVPEQKIELPVEPAPQPALAVLPPPKPPEKKAEKKKPQKHASLASAPTAAEQKADRAAAPAPGAISRNSNAVPSWKSALVARLERFKRYPDGARDHGIAQLAFSVDRSGGVHNARVVRSSGSALLDRAAVDLVQRAAPLPPPPPEVAGAQIPIVVPIQYH